MKVLKTFFSLLTSQERRNLYLLFCAVIVMAGLEVVSVGSIMPFLQVVADPASVEENAYLNWGYEAFGFSSTENYLVALGLGALGALVVSNAFIVLTTWGLYRYVWGRNHSLSRRLLRSYLYRPYEYFLTRNSAELGKNILEEVKQITGSMMMPALRGAAKASVAVFIIGFLFFVDPVVACAVTVVLGLAYVVVYNIVRDRLDHEGAERVESNTRRYQFVSEAFGGIKEVKLRGKEETFLNLYDTPSKQYAQKLSNYQLIKRAPRYILEVVAFGGIILIAVYLILAEQDVRQVIPILGLYAFAGYRLMPALQQAFKGIASARFNIEALEKIHSDLRNGPSSIQDLKESLGESQPPLRMKEDIVMNKVSFTYPGADSPTIENMSLKIKAKEMVGFVGKTGSGKTTTVDLLLGLIRPGSGYVSVDGVPLRGKQTLRRWQQNIGYVPQQIYLSDDTVAQNIAFGVPKDEIDTAAVKDAARRANIYDFITDELSDEWQTLVGERGVKLSGGQRQRIGIARALYHEPSVLVLDEATSALDQSTEASVMEAIHDLDEGHTIMMVSHRISTVKKADKIIMLEDGRKVDEGTYSYLNQKSRKFSSMVRA